MDATQTTFGTGAITGNTALLVFYAIFWGGVVNAVGRYRLFDTAALWSHEKRKYALRRLLISIAIVDLGPILLLWLLYKLLFNSSGTWSIIAAAFGSLSVFGFIRLIHAVVASDKYARCFYTDDEADDVIRKWSPFRAEAKDDNKWYAHAISGFAWIVFFFMIALIITA